ncbi:hypothetical protein L207DRAFT_163292 [Hyaloscypha variabilis F]|uniref:Uncharacterized protein n=1 Tax=Hyaloscypha variabilis (strain UAMH 11265 / GT02V1 / F) TaxID=1149755 RepID=A0A2J6SAG3_HYAVF|nr:hypothetical protein L207DRAFT_163292 [Hyaloscypha variabilis F]
MHLRVYRAFIDFLKKMQRKWSRAQCSTSRIAPTCINPCSFSSLFSLDVAPSQKSLSIVRKTLPLCLHFLDIAILIVYVLISASSDKYVVESSEYRRKACGPFTVLFGVLLGYFERFFKDFTSSYWAPHPYKSIRRTSERKEPRRTDLSRCF